MAAPDFQRLEELPVHGRPAGHRVAYVRGQPRTGQDLLAEAGGWKAAFESAGVARVALHAKEGWTFTAALLGAWAAGVSVYLPGDALPDTCAELSARVDAFAGELPERLPKPLLAPLAAPPLPAGRAFPRPPALTVFTSGSTGRGQPFEKSVQQLSAELECLEQTFGAQIGEAAVLATVSHQHIYGLLFKVLWPLCAGRPFVSETLFFPEEIAAAAEAFPTVALIASPAHLKRLPDFLGWEAVRARTRAVFSSGGPLAWDAAQRTQALLGRAPLEVFGSSETGGIAWRERTSEDARWQPFADVALALEPATQLLRVRSPKLPDAAWFTTSDKAALGADGTFQLLGRQDRVVKLEEKRISLDRVEAALRESGWVADAKVVVLTGARDSLGAVVQPNPAGAALDRKALTQALREALARKVEPVGLPRRWRFVESLPMNAQGKTPQAELLRLFDATGDRIHPDVLERSAPGPLALSLQLQLPDDLRWFQGHFPVAPVLPGVVQVDWAQHYGRAHLGVEGEFRGMERLKFQRVLQPGDRVELRLVYAPDRGRLQFHYQSARGIHSSGVMLFH